MKKFITGIFFTFIVFLNSASAQVPSYTDTHSDGSLNGWTSRGTRTWGESNNAAVPQDGSNNVGFLINNYSASSDGAIEVDITADQWNGGSGGIVLRWTSAQAFYYIAVLPGNQWGNWIKFCRNTTNTDSGTTVASNFQMPSNFTLRVEMTGSNFRFFINGTQRGQITDAIHTSGSFGYAYSNKWNRYTSFSEVRWWDRIVAQYPLTVTTTGSGTVSPQSGTYPQNTQVTVTATPAAGWVFSNWTGDAAGSTNPLTVTMNAAKNIVANFTQLSSYELTVATDGQGSVTPASGTYVQGTEVELTAIPDTGWMFVNWTGDIESQANPVIVRMTANRSVVAHFAQITHTLTIDANGSGIVSPSSGEYAEYSYVTVTATPAAGWRFSHWSGDVSGNVNPITVHVTEDQNIVANFVQIVYPLSVQTSGNGTVSPSIGAYPQGTSVQLTATPAEGWVFSSWGGDASGSVNPLTVVMNDTMNITALFVQRTFTLNVTADQNGTVSPVTATVPEGSTVEVTATPNEGYVFDSWSGDASGSQNPLSILMDGNKQIMANFKLYVPQNYTLTVESTGNGTVLPQSGSYVERSVVEVTATAADGWKFSHWEGDIQGATNPVSITINSNMTVRAVFIIDNSKILNSQKIAVSASLFDLNNQPVGRVTPVTIDLVVRIFNAEENGTLLYTEKFERATGNGVTVDDGFFVARMGEGQTSDILATVISENDNLWVEITAGGNVLPRTPLTAAPYSLK